MLNARNTKRLVIKTDSRLSILNQILAQAGGLVKIPVYNCLVDRSSRYFLALFLVMVLAIGGARWWERGHPKFQESATIKNGVEKKYTVTRVIDGDTIEINSGIKVRYIGINTPETVDSRTGVKCFGREASAFNRNLVEGKEVVLERDVSDKDKYGRLLRYVYLGEVMINEKLVREGYAQVSTYPPDVKYKDRFIEAQKEAKREQLGLWKKCV